jgi:type II secretory pathway pseudopilin PulG
MPTTSLFKRVLARWQHRTSETGSSERGDTLVEVLLAMIILGIASVALLAGFATSISASAEHRNVASLDASTRIAANEAIADIQQQAQAAEGTPTDPFTCATPFTPSFGNLTGTFTVAATAAYWTGTSWGSPGLNTFSPGPNGPGCEQYQPQQYTMVVTSTTSSSYSTSVSTVVSDPSAPPTPNVGTATQLQWLTEPGGGTAGSPIAPQPEVAVEDASGFIVQNDFSSMTLTATPVGSATGSLSNTCFGVESYGIVQFSGCSISAGGNYSIAASDGTLTPPTAGPITVTILNAPPAKLALSGAVSGTASNKATLGPVTVTLEDAFGNPVNATALTTVSLSSTSAGASFSTSSTGTPSVGSVNIPAGQSTGTFYYGDTVAGSPTVTAGASGVAPATQSETISAGSATKIGFTNNPFSAGASAPAANSLLTVAAEDTFGNPTKNNTGATIKLSLASTSKGSYILSTTQGATTPTGPNATTTIAGGSTSVNIYYGDNAQGSPSISAVASGGLTATATPQTETITTAPGKLVFSTSPVTGNAYTDANIGPITVTEETTSGQLTTVPETINLSSNSSGTYIFSPTQGATTPTGNTSVSIPNGQSSVTFYYGDTDNGSPVLTAAASGLGSVSQTETINVGPLASYALSTPTTSPTAGTSFTETITAQDAGGNTVTGDQGVTCLIFNGPANSPNGLYAPLYPAQSSCPSGSAITFTNGVGTAPITLYDAETTVLTATSGFITGSSASFNVNGATATTFVLATPSPTAGTSFGEVVTATDTYGNTATSYGGTAGQAKCVTFTGPSNAPNNKAPAYPAKGTCSTGASSVTFTSGVGVATITLYDAQTTTLTATTTITGTSAPFAVAPANLNALAVGNPGTQTAGQQFNVTATGTDAYGNGFSGSLNPTFSGPAHSPNGTAPTYPSSVTFANGTATIPVTLYDAQTTTLTMSSSGVGGTSSSFKVNTASSNGLSLSTPTPTAGTAFTETITDGDPFGNVITTLTGAQCITFSGPANSPGHVAPIYPAQGTSCGSGASSVTFANGVGTASIKLYNAQPTTLTAATTTLSGSASFTVASGPPTVLALPATPATQTAGTAFILSVNATDAYGNGYTGTLTSATNGLTFSGPATSPAPAATPPSYPTSLTFAGGVASASVTLFDAQSTTIKLAATGAASATSGSFTVNPAPASVLTATSGANQSATISTAFTSPLVVTSTDGYSNLVSGVSVTFAAPVSGASASFASTCTSNPFSYACVKATGSNGQATSSAFTANGTAGSYNISATASGLSTVTYAETNNKANQTINFTSAAPPNATVGGVSYTVSATATSGVTVTFSSGSPTVCTSSGTNGATFTFVGGGNCVVNANAALTTNYNAATNSQSFNVTSVLTIVSVQTTSAQHNEVSFSGTGSSGTPAVTVTVCDENVVPCPVGSHTITTATTGGSPGTSWTTGNTGRGALTAGAQYYAQATQTGSTSSSVFPFIYESTEPSPVSLILANHSGAAGKADAGDTVTVTFSEPLDASTICSAWVNNGTTQSMSTATIQITHASSSALSVSAATACGSTVNFGATALGADYTSSGTMNFTNSTISWNPSTYTLTFALGTPSGSAAAVVGNHIPTYTADPQMADLSGNQVSSAVLSGTSSAF